MVEILITIRVLPYARNVGGWPNPQGQWFLMSVRIIVSLGNLLDP